VGLCVALAGLCVWFGALGPAPEAGVYPENDAVIECPTVHVGSLVDVHGRVVATDPVAIQINSGADRRVIEVRGVETTVARGDVLSVYGRLETPARIEARAVVVTEPHAYWRTRVLSLIAGLVVVALGRRYWTVDTANWALGRRGANTADPEPTEEGTDA
jgi:hypothetical protein